MHLVKFTFKLMVDIFFYEFKVFNAILVCFSTEKIIIIVFRNKQKNQFVFAVDSRRQLS